MEIELFNPIFHFLAVWGTSAATGQCNGAIRIWDLDAGTSKAILDGHKKGVRSAAVDAAGQVLVSASEDKTVRVWNIGLQRCLRMLDGNMDVRCVALSEGKIFGGVSSVVRRGVVQTPAVHVWDLQTLELEGTLWHQDKPAGSQTKLDRIIVDKDMVWADCDGGRSVLVWGRTNSSSIKVKALIENLLLLAMVYEMFLYVPTRLVPVSKKVKVSEL
jgi:WD40 repeat protein